MPLHIIEFTIPSQPAYETIPVEWSHSGVVGSGDMEVLLTRTPLGGAVSVKIVTPVTGYDDIWEKVLRRFAKESGVGDLSIEINDNNSTPYVATARLRQALIEAKSKEIR